MGTAHPFEELLVWFKRSYPEIVDSMRACSHESAVTLQNPYHLEGDCWSHTMMVCKVAQLDRRSPTVLLAALLHDIGKPAVRNLNPKNGHVRFGGHEAVSAFLALPILKRMIDEGEINPTDATRVFELIALHTLLHHDHPYRKLKEWFAMRDVTLYDELISLNRADALGSFSTMETWSDGKERRLRNLEKMSEDGTRSGGKTMTVDLWLVMNPLRAQKRWEKEYPGKAMPSVDSRKQIDEIVDSTREERITLWTDIESMTKLMTWNEDTRYVIAIRLLPDFDAIDPHRPLSHILRSLGGKYRHPICGAIQSFSVDWVDWESQERFIDSRHRSHLFETSLR